MVKGMEHEEVGEVMKNKEIRELMKNVKVGGMIEAAD